MSRVPVLLSWSSGKDSAWSLAELRTREDLEVVGLLTTVNETHDRVAMHAVRRQLLEAQAKAAGLPLHVVDLPWPCSNEEYEVRMGDAVREAAAEGIRGVAFGDLFLEDIRAYRVQKLAGTGLEPHFPLWGRETRELAERMIEGGLRAVLTCVDPKQIPKEFAGRQFDHDLLRDLPATADPCGENGEFHSFVYAGPMFDYSIDVEVGEIVEREGFCYADVRPASASEVSD